MNKNEFLKDYTILDFSHRLPGPLAGKVLADMGANVIKVEDNTHKDAFLSGFFSNMDDSFEDWYKELNQQKKLVRFDFKSDDAKSKVHELLESADAIIIGMGDKLKTRLGLDSESIKNLNKPIVMVNMGSSATIQKGMHDINALGFAGFLSLFIQDKHDDVVAPPFFPFSGIAYGQQLATDVCAGILRSIKENRPIETISYLYETAVDIFTPFWSEKMRSNKRTKFLQNGAYPCYSLYKLKDEHYIALAAVEEKFWTRLLEVFPIELTAENRFDTNKQSFQLVSEVFKKYTHDEIFELTDDKDLCLSLIKRV